MDFITTCTPAMVYIGLAVVGLIRDLSVDKDKKGMQYFWNVAVDVIMVGLIAYLCRSGYTKTAWALVFAPLILFFMLLLLVLLFFKTPPTSKTSFSYSSFL